MEGWAKAGEGLAALFGGGQARQDAVYRERVAENAGLEQRLAAASKARSQAMAIDAIANDESIPLQQRNFIVGELAGQFSNYEQGALRQQERGFRDDARTALAGGNFDEGNAILAALNGKPLELTQVEGGGRFALNPYRENAPMATTDYGKADIARLFTAGQANTARAGASNASAAASLARAANYDARTAEPERFRAPPRAAIETPTTPPASAPAVTIPQGAIDMLRSNPGLAGQFDAKYGPGAAAAALGGR